MDSTTVDELADEVIGSAAQAAYREVCADVAAEALSAVSSQRAAARDGKANSGEDLDPSAEASDAAAAEAALEVGDDKTCEGDDDDESSLELALAPGTATGFKGVYTFKLSDGTTWYRAALYSNGKHRYLGPWPHRFADARCAAMAHRPGARGASPPRYSLCTHTPRTPPHPTHTHPHTHRMRSSAQLGGDLLRQGAQGARREGGA